MECRKCIQVALNGTLTIPDQMPDIDFILRVTSTPIIDHSIVIDKQISFSGHVLICIETVSSKADCPQTVHFISFEVPFVGLIDHCCARSGMDVQLSASIKHQEFKMLSAKCINKLIVVKIGVIRLTKSCTSVNAHCSEPRLTLSCKTISPPACPSTKPCTNAPMKPIDCQSDPNHYYLPQTLQACHTGQVAKAPCIICGSKIDDI